MGKGSVGRGVLRATKESWEGKEVKRGSDGDGSQGMEDKPQDGVVEVEGGEGLRRDRESN